MLLPQRRHPRRHLALSCSFDLRRPKTYEALRKGNVVKES